MGPEMTRYPNWPERLADTIQAAYERPFVYGEWDCCLFAAHVVYQLTGIDFSETYRGYKSQAGASLMLHQNGGVEGIATRHLGEPIPPLMARRGDVVTAIVDRQESLGICDGPVGIFLTMTGITQIPLADCNNAWRVG